MLRRGRVGLTSSFPPTRLRSLTRGINYVKSPYKATTTVAPRREAEQLLASGLWALCSLNPSHYWLANAAGDVRRLHPKTGAALARLQAVNARLDPRPLPF